MQFGSVYVDGHLRNDLRQRKDGFVFEIVRKIKSDLSKSIYEIKKTEKNVKKTFSSNGHRNGMLNFDHKQVTRNLPSHCSATCCHGAANVIMGISRDLQWSWWSSSLTGLALSAAKNNGTSKYLEHIVQARRASCRRIFLFHCQAGRRTNHKTYIPKEYIILQYDFFCTRTNGVFLAFT